MALRDFIAPIGSAIGVNLNSVADTAVTLPNGAGKYIITDMVVTNPSTSLAASAATIGAYSAASAGGEALVTPATATGLTAATKFNRRTIAQDDTVTAGTIYVRVGVVHGSAATCDVYFYGYILAAS